MIEPVAPQVRMRNNGFAIASLLLSLFGILISNVFGIIALVQIKRYGGHGKDDRPATCFAAEVTS